MDMSFLLGLVAQYPILASILMVVGILRLVIKPIFSIAYVIADETVSKADEEFIKKIEDSTVMKGLVFALDWLASVKLINPNKL